MGALSEAVLAHQGVLVDYIGDELMAMWGAPSEQPEHAAMACRAALDMIARLPEMSKKWEPTLGEPLELGIGLNTGQAQVGNTGTARKFKYGPLGTTVNLASRVQGATKHFKARLLITEGTRQAIDDSFATRRLGKVRVVNIDELVELYELFPTDHPDRAALQAGYESALNYYLDKEFRPAAGILGNLQVNFPGDGPSLVLLSRVVNALCDHRAFSDVWTLESK
jgi:adenylate cyclase